MPSHKRIAIRSHLSKLSTSNPYFQTPPQVPAAASGESSASANANTRAVLLGIRKNPEASPFGGAENKNHLN